MFAAAALLSMLAAAHLPPCSPDATERLAGVIAIGELAGTKVFGESPARLSDLVKVLMDVFQQPGGGYEVHTLQLAAHTLGQLVRAGGALMADVVEEQVGWVGARGAQGGGALVP